MVVEEVGSPPQLLSNLVRLTGTIFQLQPRQGEMIRERERIFNGRQIPVLLLLSSFLFFSFFYGWLNFFCVLVHILCDGSTGNQVESITTVGTSTIMTVTVLCSSIA